jgi:hypothetical protein
MIQLILHLIGDYVTQSDWMAVNKTKRSVPAAAHALVYSLPFLLLTGVGVRGLVAWLIILDTHFLIDRYRLARYVVWAKNWIGPGNRPWSECTATGYPPGRPDWLCVWLLIIADNTMHLAINYSALRWL